MFSVESELGHLCRNAFSVESELSHLRRNAFSLESERPYAQCDRQTGQSQLSSNLCAVNVVDLP